MKKLRILGTRGIPAKHGGFETFAEHLARYLVKQGWNITVYCQAEPGSQLHEEHWQGIRLIHIPAALSGAASTIIFDLKSVLHALRHDGVVLTLGYNTAVFCGLFRIFRINNLINMDGLEWKREKWSHLERAWLFANERLGCWFGNHLVADHPEIKHHLMSRAPESKITMIPYGADRVSAADPTLIEPLGVRPGEYAIVIARPEPENSILEIVQAFSAKPRGLKLVVLGTFAADNRYHQRVRQAASEEVVFPGAIYDSPVVQSLRFHARLYIHGHQVGGTNPSLVEALGAGSAILAHDNPFNRWVAGPGNHYFTDAEECRHHLDAMLDDETELQLMRTASVGRFQQDFTWQGVLESYESLLERWLPNAKSTTGSASGRAESASEGQ